MLKYALLAATAAVAFAAAPATATSYMPTGPQNDVPWATVLGGGWTVCFAEPYGTYGTSIASALSRCTGTHLMMAGAENGSANIKLLAQAAYGDVTTITGDGNNVTHNANGTEWYFSHNYSWGFAPGGDTVLRSSCDASGVFDSNMSGYGQRLCWHTGAGNLDGGWRVGDAIWLNSEPSGYTRYLLTNGVVPEPATWAMMIAGFGLVGAAVRRRRLAHARA